MSKNILNTLLICSMALVVASQAGVAFASETIGTLSTSNAAESSPHNQLTFTVIDRTQGATNTPNEWLSTFIKILLISCLVIEIIILTIISVVKKKKRRSLLSS